jgi:hypothetical protein
MRRIHRIYVATVITLAVPLGIAQAQTKVRQTKWAACYMQASGGVGTSIALLVFEPFMISNETGTVSAYGLAIEFQNKVGVATVVSGYAPITGSYTNGCSFDPSQDEARIKVDQMRNRKGYAIIKTVAWTPPATFTGVGGASSNVRVTGSSGSKGAYLGRADVVDFVPPIEPGWDAKIREQQRRDVASRAKAIATSARAKAESEAALTKMIGEMRERGRAQ